MNNGLARRDDNNNTTAYEDPTGGRLIAWASSLQAAHQIAVAICSTSFAPAHFRGKPDEGAAAIMNGDELGLSPLQALQGTYVISGKPSLYARTMVAIVQARGHDVWTVDKTDESVTVHGKRRGSEHVIVETWTTERARKAGYTNNKKYQTDPQAMLYARAAADVCRQVAPDALAGIAYTVEEMELAPLDTGTEVSIRSAGAQMRARMKAATVPEVESEVVEGETVDESTEDAPETITDNQMRAMQASFKDLGITDPEGKRAYCSEKLNRPVTSAKLLTPAEASTVIAALHDDAKGTQP